ncbi:MAG: hypothetical protein M3118_08095, partial [Actinomycetota bacterium]|nr:hypothetical protein [Actinomycetota bacterium]
SAVFLAVCWMTTQVFPYHYLEVVQGRSSGIDILLGRNLLLLLVWGLMLSLPSNSEPARGTVRKTTTGQEDPS